MTVDNPDERFSEADYAEAAEQAERRSYPPAVDCEVCGEAVTNVNRDGVCRWCEQIVRADG